MLLIERSIEEAGGPCNFCELGYVDGTKVRYPYETVFLVSGDSKLTLTPKFCKKCLRKLYIKLKDSLDK